MSRSASALSPSFSPMRDGMDGAGSLDGTSMTSHSSLPDFNAQHSQYTRGLLKGRHPRSFPKQSELWHHYKASASRLDRVTKGHNLWNIVEEQDKYDQLPSPVSEGGSNLPLARSVLNHDIGGTRYIPKSTLHGLHVDMKGVLKMHYGMNIVLLNCSDEVLCVNQYDEVLCKPEALLDDGDEICFKLIDLAEPTNPGPIEYGKPIWLQTLRSSSDNNIHFGFVLTSKLFGPPEMESTQLSNPPKRRQAPSRLKTRPSFNSNMSNSFVAPPFGDSADLDYDSEADQFKKSFKEGERSKKEKEKKSSEMSEVCGGISVIRAYNNKNDVSMIDTDMTRFRSRQASHLGCWTVQNALKTGEPSKFVQSCTSIYLSQDLYCLATSHGNLYDPWPRTVEVNKIQAQVEKKKDVQKLSKLAESPFFSPTKSEDKSRVSVSSGSENDAAATKARVVPTFTNNLPHGCLRRVVERGAPYSHTVDRRCVWKFCVADNPRDLKLLSVKEQKAHKLLRKANAGLNKSKQNRLGGRVHEGYEMNGEPLIGGEKFPRLLRNIVSQESLKLETMDMLDRRHKEEVISDHLRCMYEGSPTKYRERRDAQSQNETEKKSDHVFAKPRAAFNRVRNRAYKSETPGHDLGASYEYTFGHEMLQIHQSFSSVNNKVTGSIMKTSMQNALNNTEDMRRRRKLANVDSSPQLTVEDSIDALKSQKEKAESDSVGKKLDLLSREDDKVMLALHYQSRLNNKVSIGNLFEDVLDDEECNSGK